MSGIAGRGVLIDFQRFAAARGIAFMPGERYGITAEQLQAAADWQGLRFQTGDILLLRTGWIERLAGLSLGNTSRVSLMILRTFSFFTHSMAWRSETWVETCVTIKRSEASIIV